MPRAEMYFLEAKLDPLGQKILNKSKIAPMKTYPALVEIQSNHNHIPSKDDEEGRSLRSYWSWTFGLTTFPFFFWGCPFYLLTSTPYQITGTGSWLKHVFDFCSFPFTTTLSVFLLIPTVLLNGYVFYVVGDIFNRLFITGEYQINFAKDFVQVVRYVPVLIPLDYVWLRGFKISNMIRLLNYLYGKYGGVGCGLFRLKLVLIIFVILGVQIIRYWVYDRYEFSTKITFSELAENAFQFSLDVYLSFLLPLYCTFCYAIRYQLFIVKGFLYKLLYERVRPNISHLNKVKTIFTHASDQIMSTNDFFSIYLSVALLIMIVGTVFDAGSMWQGLIKIAGGGMFSGILGMIAAIGVGTNMDGGEEFIEANSTNTTATAFTPAEIREINFDIACVILTYLLIFFTVWQAVGTNDCVREVQIWLNDFVTGGGGTDVLGVLESLGVSPKKGKISGVLKVESKEEDEDEEENKVIMEERERRDYFLQELPLVWGRNTLLDSGTTDEFLKKFRNLKAFIHSRMQTEKPALLNIALLILLAPPLSPRLRGYRLVF